MTIRIGRVAPDDILRFVRAMGTPFAFDVEPDEEEDLLTRFGSYFEPDRARVALDGDEIVGTLGSFSFDMTVPGGSAPVAGTTMVTVLPTHRRRGLLRRLMSDHFDDARERGEPLAALYASDSAIYGRFGYGLASLQAQVTIPRSHVELHRLAPPSARVRMVEPTEAESAIPPIFDAFRVTRPGSFRRSEKWWAHRRFRDRAADRGGSTAYRYALADGPDGPEGYVQYRLKEGWENHHGHHTVRVRELIGLTPEAVAALWQLVLSHDLAGSIEAHDLPVDSPLFDLLAAGRRAAPTLTDQLWVKVLDVPAALSARRYAVEGELVMSVHDPFDGSEGTYRLSGAPEGASCVSSTADPDISLDVEDLGACLMGRARFRELARAGRLTGTKEGLARADLMFSWDPPPWCQEVF